MATASKRKTIILTVLVVLGCQILAMAVFMLSGLYPIGANSPHTLIVEGILSGTMDRAVVHHARNLRAPEKMDMTGIPAHFQEMCAFCHGAPGVERSEIGKGLYPQAPDLHEEAGDWSTEDVFWIIKNGIKDTGMPAFGLTHNTETMWALAKFTKELPKLTQDEYKKLTAEGQGAREAD